MFYASVIAAKMSAFFIELLTPVMPFSSAYESSPAFVIDSSGTSSLLGAELFSNSVIPPLL